MSRRRLSNVIFAMKTPFKYDICAEDVSRMQYLRRWLLSNAILAKMTSLECNTCKDDVFQCNICADVSLMYYFRRRRLSNLIFVMMWIRCEKTSFKNVSRCTLKCNIFKRSNLIVTMSFACNTFRIILRMWCVVWTSFTCNICGEDDYEM